MHVCFLQDYLVCEGYNQPKLEAGRLSLDIRYYASQDGIKWIDLAETDKEIAAHSRRLSSKLSGIFPDLLRFCSPKTLWNLLQPILLFPGDPSHVYTIEQSGDSDPSQLPDTNDEYADEPQKLVVQVTELQRLRTIVEDIASATSVVPKVTDLNAIHSMSCISILSNYNISTVSTNSGLRDNNCRLQHCTKLYICWSRLQR